LGDTSTDRILFHPVVHYAVIHALSRFVSFKLGFTVFQYDKERPKNNGFESIYLINVAHDQIQKWFLCMLYRSFVFPSWEAKHSHISK
jgi:hypothetical protein